MTSSTRTPAKVPASAPHYSKLKHATLVVRPDTSPVNRSYLLGAGSIVARAHSPERGVVLPAHPLKKTEDLYIRYADAGGVQHMGWVSPKTVFVKTVETTARTVSRQDDKSPVMVWDRKRSATLVAQSRSTASVAPVQRAGRFAVPDVTEKEAMLAKTKKTAKKGSTKTTAEAVSTKTKKSASPKSEKSGGRYATFTGKKIIRLVKENPRREGSFAFKNWKKIRGGMTFEQYLEAGGDFTTLKTDIVRGYVKLK